MGGCEAGFVPSDRWFRDMWPIGDRGNVTAWVGHTDRSDAGSSGYRISMFKYRCIVMYIVHVSLIIHFSDVGMLAVGRLDIAHLAMPFLRSSIMWLGVCPCSVATCWLLVRIYIRRATASATAFF